MTICGSSRLQEAKLLKIKEEIDRQCNACSAGIAKMHESLKAAKVGGRNPFRPCNRYPPASSLLLRTLSLPAVIPSLVSPAWDFTGLPGLQREYLVGRMRGLDRSYHFPLYLSWTPFVGRAWQVPAYEFERVGQEVRRLPPRRTLSGAPPPFIYAREGGPDVGAKNRCDHDGAAKRGRRGGGRPGDWAAEQQERTMCPESLSSCLVRRFGPRFASCLKSRCFRR